MTQQGKVCEAQGNYSRDGITETHTAWHSCKYSFKFHIQEIRKNKIQCDPLGKFYGLRLREQFCPIVLFWQYIMQINKFLL